MERLEDLLIFVRTADAGSLSAAARDLDLTPAAASGALKRLEDALQTRLLARSTRSLRLTPDGERYLDYARNALATLAAGKDALAHGKQLIGGTLSLSVPSDLGRHVLLPWLDEFQNTHPRVRLQIRISDRLADMFRQSVDLVIRYGKPEDSSLVALPLAPDNIRVLCAAPSYLERHGAPASIAALSEHNCLCFMTGESVYDHWRLGQGEHTRTVAVAGNRVSDDAELVRRWALAGHGIAYKSRLDIQHDLNAGRLVRLLGDTASESYPLYLLCPHRRMVSPTVETLRSFLAEKITLAP